MREVHVYISCSMVGTAKGWEGRDTWWRWRCRWGVGCGKHQLFVAVGDVLDDARLVEVEQLRVVRAVSGRVARVHLRRAELHLRPATHRPHHAAGTQGGSRRRLVISGDHHRLHVRLVRSPDRVSDPNNHISFVIYQRHSLGRSLGCQLAQALRPQSAHQTNRRQNSATNFVYIEERLFLDKSRI